MVNQKENNTITRDDQKGSRKRKSRNEDKNLKRNRGAWENFQTSDHTYFSKKELPRKPACKIYDRNSLKDENNNSVIENIIVNECIDLDLSEMPQKLQNDSSVSFTERSGLLSIKGKKFVVQNVPGDGNCFFHCLSLGIHGNNNYVSFYRNLICRSVARQWDNFKDTANLCHDKIFHSPNEYLVYMLEKNAWATACEIKAASSVLNVHITTYVQGLRYNNWLNCNEVSYNEIVFSSENRPDKCIFVLLAHGHFQLLLQKNDSHEIPAISYPDNTKEHYQEVPQSHNTAHQCQQENHVNTSSTTAYHPPACQNSNPIFLSSKNGHNLSNRKTSSNNDSSVKINHPKSYQSQKKVHREFVYLPEEADLFAKCRKLGLSFESAQETESKNEKAKRVRRNRKKVHDKEKKLNIDSNTLPGPPPLSEDAQFNIAMDAIRSFELEQMSYNFNLCSICKERRLNMTVSNENICRRCLLDKNEVKMYSTENKMNPGPVPVELQNLSMTEQQLICRISPAMHVHMLKHGGIASSGHCVTFPQDINEPAQILPKLPQEMDIIKVRKKGKNDTSKEFRVRRYVVQSALQWLKNNNTAYADIIISQERLNSLPEDGEISLNDINVESFETLHDEGPAPEQQNLGEISGESDSCVLLPEPSLNIQEKVQKVIEEVVGPDHGDVSFKRNMVTIPWPTRENVPISEFTTRNFFTLAFPCLFPTSIGDFYMNRPRTCSSLSDWADHLIWYSDGRFAKHPYFKFIVHNMIMRKRTLEQSTYIVQQQLGDKHLTVSDIKEKLQKGDKSIAEKILYFGACLRGTNQYWAQRSKELRSLIQFQINESKGLPSFFTTGSCAEYHFKALRRLLQLYILETTGSEVDLGDRNNLFGALQSNTHVVAHYFDLRTSSYFRKVMGPVFGVETYWYRQEFAKSRGMIHWHGLCWRQDREPHNLIHEAITNGLKDEDCAEVLASWAKSEFGLTALHPAGKNEDGTSRKDLWPPPEGTAPLPPEEKNPLIKLLMDVSETQESIVEDHLLLTNRINLHRCSDYCLRNPRSRVSVSNRSQKVCRLEFGTIETPGKPLRSTPAIVKDRNKCDRLELERDHPMLVQHSQFHTQGWRANGDISLILSRSNPDDPSVDEIIATEKYVTGYACKGNESTGSLVDLFNDMANAADEASGATAKSLCTKLLMDTVKRDVSSVEAAFELSLIPLYRCSHQFQSVSMTGSRVLERTGSTLTKSTPLDKYLDREKKDTTSWYEFICKSGKVPVLSGGAIRATWPLEEDFCRTMLLLHWKNWRAIADIKSSDETWKDCMLKFLETNVCPNFVKADVERAVRKANSNDLEDEYSDSDSNEIEVDQPEWMELIAPNDVYDDLSSDFHYDDGGPDYDWSSTTLGYPLGLGLKWLDEIASSSKEKELPLNLPDVTVPSLNKEQRFAYNLVMTKLFNFLENPENFVPLRMIVAGTAGSGKSFLIKCLVRSIRQLFNNNKAVQVLCPTGNSANLISGVTLHSFLKIPTTSFKANKELCAPDGVVGDNLQKNCDGVVALLVDERSMIGCTTLGWMEYHSRFAMNKGLKSSLPWGGLPVVVFLGDDVQLPPVCDFPVYKCISTTPAAMHGSLVWQEFDTAVTLTTLVRQDESQRMLREVLLSMREYKTTKEQAHWLQQFQWDSLRKSHGIDLLNRMNSEGLFVFPNHADEWSHNKTKLLEMNTKYPIAAVKAQGTGTHSKSESGDKAGGLVRCLYLCRDARVMLTTNINVPFGLYNGSMGKVIDIIYNDGRNPNTSLPDVVMVEFPKYTGPAFMQSNPQVVPIVPVERRVECRCNSCKRKQIPLRLGWGTTIHRSQGMTIGHRESNRYIVINPGPRQFECRTPGALFVALSRAKSAGGNGTDPDFAWHPHLILNEDRLCHQVNTPTTRARKNEIDRINRISESTKHKFSNLYEDNAFQTTLAKLNNFLQRHEE